MTSRIILLNDVGSVGKSSIARALQTLAELAAGWRQGGAV